MADEQQQPDGDNMDRFERDLEHLLQMQAKHKSAARSRLQRIETDTEARFDNLTEALIRLPGIVEHLAEAQRAWGEETDRRFRQTDARLNALIKFANGIIQKPPPPGA